MTCLRQIRGLSSVLGGNTPAIALTAFAHTEDRAPRPGAGYQMHVAKPVEPAELRQPDGNIEWS
jgi:CheY-like chemotaxis protein